jgi:hypothetical protein
VDCSITRGRRGGAPMTPAAKITYVVAVILGLVGGLLVGFRAGTSASISLFDAQRMAATAELTDFSYMQYKHADPQNAKEALLTCAKFLEEMEQEKPDNMQKHDLVLAYARLAVLEDAGQNAEQSQAYMNQARSWNKASGGPDFSDIEMKAVLKKLDEAASGSRDSTTPKPLPLL